MQKGFKFDYDAENDLLFVFNPAKKSKGSIEFGELIVDIEKKGEIAGPEIFDASKYLSGLANTKISKKELAKLETAFFSYSAKKGTILIKISLKTGKKEILAPLAIQDMQYKSPILVLAKQHSF